MSWLNDALSYVLPHDGYNSVGDAAKAFWMPQAYASEQNMKMTMMTNAQNRANIEYQNQMNLEQWRRENAYNDPVNQMQRMRSAGLNPGLMYGGSGSIATSAPSPMMQGARDVAPQLAGYDSPLDKLLSIQQQQAMIKNIDADTDKKRSDIDLNNSNIRVNDDSIEVGHVRLEIDKNLSNAQVGYLSKQTEDIERKWSLLDADIDLVRSKIDLTNSQTAAQDMDNFFNSEVMSARIDNVYAELKQKKLDIEISKEQFKELCEMFVINKQIAGEQLSQLISQGKFDEQLRPYQLLEQQNDAWQSGQELQTARFNLSVAKEKHGRHTVAGRYVDDLLGSVGQVLGGTASHTVTTNRTRASKPIIKTVR